jgi:hypothetical protein
MGNRGNEAHGLERFDGIVRQIFHQARNDGHRSDRRPKNRIAIGGCPRDETMSDGSGSTRLVVDDHRRVQRGAEFLRHQTPDDIGHSGRRIRDHVGDLLVRPLVLGRGR